MFVNVDEEFDKFAATRFKPNPPVSEMDLLGEYCVWLGQKYGGDDFDSEEGDWLDLWERMGVSAGDGAEIVATTLSKMSR
jgi:hypothetical protein